MKNTTVLNIFTDGGSRGNPGPAAFGVYIENENHEVLAKLGHKIGINTNNIAEYSGILAGLRWVFDNLPLLPSLERVNFFMDSNLAASQLNGVYKIKNGNIRNLFFMIKQKETEIKHPIFYSHIPREKNKQADKLVNMALDDFI